MSDPRIVLLDEPTLGLAPIMVDVVFDLLVDLRGARPHRARRRAERPAGAGDRRPRLRAAHRPRSPSRAPAPSWPPTRTCSGTSSAGRRRDVSSFVQTLVDGIGRGSTYALLALGISLIFGVMHLVNFAHAELITVGAYVAYFLSTRGRRLVGARAGDRARRGRRVGRHRAGRVPLGPRRQPVHDAAHVVRPRAAVARRVGRLRVADASSRSPARAGCSTRSRSAASASR